MTILFRGTHLALLLSRSPCPGSIDKSYERAFIKYEGCKLASLNMLPLAYRSFFQM